MPETDQVFGARYCPLNSSQLAQGNKKPIFDGPVPQVEDQLQPNITI